GAPPRRPPSPRRCAAARSTSSTRPSSRASPTRTRRSPAPSSRGPSAQVAGPEEAAMRIGVERVPTPPATELVEVVTPRTNLAAIGAAENLLAAISLAEPFGLEIAATGRARRFLARAGSPAMRRHLTDQLGVAYPQAELRPLLPGDDPA